jgi:hypothetical protein
MSYKLDCKNRAGACGAKGTKAVSPPPRPHRANDQSARSWSREPCDEQWTYRNNTSATYRLVSETVQGLCVLIRPKRGRIIVGQCKREDLEIIMIYSQEKSERAYTNDFTPIQDVILQSSGGTRPTATVYCRLNVYCDSTFTPVPK